VTDGRLGGYRKKIVLIAKHFGPNAGGEAIKAYQFAAYLRDHGAAPIVITHERAVTNQGGNDLGLETIVVPDTAIQKLFWRLPPLRGLLDIHFQLAARRLIRAHVKSAEETVLHYIGPVSPVLPRFFPKGYDVVLGPVTGNIYYPPAFRHRMSRKARLSERLHGIAQRVLRVTLREKQRVRVILVSGYERTRVSLRLAGAREDQMVDVVDSGVSDRVRIRPRISHAGINARFICSGRMVDYKGFDLAIRAVARADPAIHLDVYGDGETRASLEALAQEEGVADRVRFLGWFKNADLLDSLPRYRGYVFPTLAEANGIAMQEAMMVGLPVIATRWGGPEKLADEAGAWYVDPVSEDSMIDAMAQAMTSLARDPERAEQMSRRARAIAEARFSWEEVSRRWIEAAYGAEFLVSRQSENDLTTATAIGLDSH
jgi:glycosyltransferase involved in cell wall biosynthesis